MCQCQKKGGKSIADKNWRRSTLPLSVHLCISYATEGSTCLHKLGRSCTTKRLRKFTPGFEGTSLAEAAIAPLSGVPGKNTPGLSLDRHTAFLPDSTQTKAQLGQARRPGLYKPVKETMSRKFCIFH